MTDPYVGEIRIFAGNFAPVNWALCNGQLIPIQQNTALFSILGTFYGGNGTSNFALPNLQNAMPMHAGTGVGLSPREIGESGGSAAVTLTINQLPMHSHQLQAKAALGTTASTANTLFAEPHSGRAPDAVYAPRSGNTTAPMSTTALAATGGNQPHNNLSPYLALNFIIALQGIYPSRS